MKFLNRLFRKVYGTTKYDCSYSRHQLHFCLIQVRDGGGFDEYVLCLCESAKRSEDRLFLERVNGLPLYGCFTCRSIIHYLHVKV